MRVGRRKKCNVNDSGVLDLNISLIPYVTDPSLQEQELQNVLDRLSTLAIDRQCNEKVDGCGILGATALHVAAGIGNVMAVRLLLDHDANVGLVDCRGQTAMHWSARNNHCDCTEELVNAFPSLVNWQDYQGRTPLHLAATVTDDNSVLEVLLSVPNILPSPIDNRFSTPLHIAASCGATSAVKTLLSRGIQPAACRDDRGATPMHYAALNNHWSVFALLMTACGQGDQVEDITDNEGLSPLLWASLSGAGDFLERYSSAYANGDQPFAEQAPNGASAAHLAAQAGHLGQLRILTSAKRPSASVTCPIEAEDALGLTPLHYAASAGRLEVVRELVALRPGLTHRADLRGYTALHWAARHGQVQVCLALLQDDGASSAAVEALDAIHGHSPVHLACAHGCVATLGALLDRCRRCWTRLLDAEGSTPLHIAAYHGHFEASKLLLDRVWEARRTEAVNLSRPGVTPLDLALHRGWTLLSELLIERGGMTFEARREAAVRLMQKTVRSFLASKTQRKR